MNDNETGLTAVSLVDYPAVERDFLLFDKQEILFKADDEKQIISGIALLADTPIYRRNERGEFYVIFESDTIRKLVEKYSKDGMFNSVNLMHKSDAFVNSVYLIESIIIDKERGICPKEFDDVPNGSWYVSYYVEDKQLWNEIKKGEWFKGFSVEITANLEKDQNKTLNTNMNKLFFKIAKKLLKLSEVVTDKATLIIEGEIEVGQPVAILIDGEVASVEDGDYVMEDGTIIKIEDGVIVEIIPIEAPKEEIATAEEVPAEEPVDTKTPELEAKIAELEAKIAELESIIEEKDKEIEELNAKIAEQEEKLKMSVEKPVTKQVKTDKENKALKYFG